MSYEIKNQIAEDICELNRWQTPERINRAVKRGLTREETRLVHLVLETYVPQQEWLKVWNEQRPGMSEMITETKEG